jgi:hypothetical protein
MNWAKGSFGLPGTIRPASNSTTTTTLVKRAAGIVGNSNNEEASNMLAEVSKVRFYSRSHPIAT